MDFLNYPEAEAVSQMGKKKKKKDGQRKNFLREKILLQFF